ncbi:DUF6966 domain-containing protein [Flavobacterium sp. RHBU_3]|uniref:DUF6966 domain-containing protein n=1 Tax=Flavobacterium sp. RHBU_3 TaxID=3391184 RepID=UPI0039850745
MGIKEHCEAIYHLLVQVGETGWAVRFDDFIAQLETGENKAVYRNILSVYGGAGSFADLVLYKDGALCMEENDELNRLRNGLYSAIGSLWD